MPGEDRLLSSDETLRWSAGRVMEAALRVDSCYPLSSLSSLLFTFEPGPSSPSLIYRGSPLTPRPLAGPRDKWPSACQYCTIFQFPVQEEEFKGLSEVQRHSVVPPAHTTHPAPPILVPKTPDPNIQPRTYQKAGPRCVNKTTPAAIILPDRHWRETQQPLWVQRYKEIVLFKSECPVCRVRPMFAWYWPVVTLTADMRGFKGSSVRKKSEL